MTRRTTLLATGAALLLSAAFVPSAGSAALVDPYPVGAVAAAESLAAGASGTSYFSAELVAELGYRPGTQDAGDGGYRSATNPTGDCSSPVPLPASFEAACMTHDLGYDLLRVADRTGEPIPTGLRRDLDRQMAAQMADFCGASAAGCRAMAGVAHSAVALNTVRQHNGAPVEEYFPW